MDIEALTKLNELKEQGFITQEEFNKQKDILINNTTDHQSDSKKKKETNWGGRIFGLVCLAFVGCGLWAENRAINFACDEKSMKKAQDLINKGFPNWNNSLRLSNPVIVKQSENYLKCKASSNFREFPTMSYELTKQSDGSLLIQVNPIKDKINKAFDKL